MNPVSRLVFTGCACVGLGFSSAAQSAWLPAAGELSLTPGYTFLTYDTFLVGKVKMAPLKANGASFDQHTGFISAEYGLSENFAADLTVGYTRASTGKFNGFGRTSVDGLADTTFGLRYRLVDEAKAAQAWMPTLALRVGGIIEGTYDLNNASPLNAGDGASGVEIALLLGKEFGDTGFGFFGDLGWRHRAEDVPEDIFGSAGIFQRFAGFTGSFAYRHTQGLSGGDIGGPGFGTAYGFQQVREIAQLIEGGLGYTDAGGRTYQFTVAQKVAGRNTGNKLVLGFAITLPFQLKN